LAPLQLYRLVGQDVDGRRQKPALRLARWWKRPTGYLCLLQVMDNGKLTDLMVDEDFRNVIITIMTNAGASEMAKPSGLVAFARR
jgi:hypothetical protein